MQLNFIGTGDCAGIPAYGCSCTICTKAKKLVEFRRQHSCALLSTPDQNILIDAGIADIGSRLPQPTLNRIFVTHYHADHVLGLFSMRWGVSASRLPVHGPKDSTGCDDLLRHEGIFDFSDTLEPFATRNLGDLTVTPLPLTHSRPSLGYLFSHDNASLAWLCDTGPLGKESLEYLMANPPQVMVIDCTFPPQTSEPEKHHSFPMALQLHEQIQPETTYLTHVSHGLDLWLLENDYSLPPSVSVAHDGLSLNILP